jgi:hypothetical protein
MVNGSLHGLGTAGVELTNVQVLVLNFLIKQERKRTNAEKSTVE